MVNMVSRLRESGPWLVESSIALEQPARPKCTATLALAGLVKSSGALEQPARLDDNRVVDQATIDRDRGRASGLGLLEGLDDSAGIIDLIGGWREDAVDDSDLVWINRRLALKTQPVGRAGVLFEAVVVSHVEPDRVERRLESGGARGQRDL